MSVRTEPTPENISPSAEGSWGHVTAFIAALSGARKLTGCEPNLIGRRLLGMCEYLISLGLGTLLALKFPCERAASHRESCAL